MKAEEATEAVTAEKDPEDSTTTTKKVEIEGTDKGVTDTAVDTEVTEKVGIMKEVDTEVIEKVGIKKEDTGVTIEKEDIEEIGKKEKTIGEGTEAIEKEVTLERIEMVIKDTTDSTITEMEITRQSDRQKSRN